MDDNELENEREKREHELELAKLEKPDEPMNFWQFLDENWI